MDNRNERDSQNKDFDYKKLSEDEAFLGNLMNTTKKQSNNKRDDLEKIIYREDSNSNGYKNIAKTIPWFAEYKKQTITITKKKIRAYLRNYKDLKRLIEYRKQKIETGEIESESKELDINNFGNYDFLEKTLLDKQTFLTSTDYKIQEMEFYQKELYRILNYLKKYNFATYQFLVLKYYLKLSDENLKITTNIEKTEYIDNVIIEYIYQKLCEEAK